MTERSHGELGVSRARTIFAGLIGAASFAFPIAAGVEAIADIPSLVERSQEAGKVTNYLGYKYGGGCKWL